MSLFNYEYTCPKCGKKFEKLDEGDFVFEDITAYICKCKNCKNVFTLCSNEPQRCPKCEKFNLEAGEELKVSWNLEKGSVDLVIKNSAGEEIYKADGRKAEDKSEFSVAAAESGEYTVYVSAHKAKGNIKVEHK